MNDLIARLEAARGTGGGSAIYADEDAIVDAIDRIASLEAEVERLKAEKDGLMLDLDAYHERVLQLAETAKDFKSRATASYAEGAEAMRGTLRDMVQDELRQLRKFPQCANIANALDTLDIRFASVPVPRSTEKEG